MLKKVAAVVLILLAGGAWLYLDYMNKQEIKAAEELHRAMDQARAEAKARADAIVKLQSQLQTDLTNCQAAAEQTKNEYVAKNQQPVRRKPGQFTIPQAVADEAAKMLGEANAACQQTYETRLRTGS